MPMPDSKRMKAAVVVPGLRTTVAEDSMTEVLLRLPVKSVARCRAVCRSWAALLSSDEFCALYRAVARAAAPAPKLLHFSPTAGFDATAAYARPLLPSPGPGQDERLFTLNYARGNRVEVLTPAPCHGLTLLYDAIARAYYVCNAATRAVARLPPSDEVAPAHWRSCSTGLGFDARTREHKVVRLVRGAYPPRREHQETIRCEVYTTSAAGGNRCWRPPASGGVPFGLRRAAASAVANADEQRLTPVFASGFLHWLIEPHNVFRRPRFAIVLFSVADETFGCVREPYFPPPDVRPNQHLAFPGGIVAMPRPEAPAGHLAAMDSQLCLVRDLHGDPYTSALEIWRLTTPPASGPWTIGSTCHRTPPGESYPQTVRVIGNGGGPGEKKMVITTCKHKVLEKFEKKVLSYDLGSQALETILTAIETNTSWNGYDKSPPSRFSLYEERMIAPVHKTEEEMALSSAPAKAAKEILLRLPAKSVVQYKVVCKQWLGLIESESFFQAYSEYRNMGRRPKLMLVGKGAGGQSAFSFAPFDPWLGAGEAPATGHGALLDEKVVCSKPCHGMNLVSTATRDYLYNPATGFHKSYPNTRIPRMCEQVAGRSVGLTFDPLSRQHALVEIVYRSKDFGSRLYSALSAILRCGNYGHHSRDYVLAPPPLPVHDAPPACVGGVLYWMSDPRLGRSRERAVVSFDVATRTFDVVPCPPCIAAWSGTSPCRAFVVELGGALCAVLADPEENSLDVWRLERGGGWGRACVIRLDGAPPGYDLGTNDVVPLAVDPDDGRILLSAGRRIGLYDPAEQTVQDLRSLDGNGMEDGAAALVPMVYQESLACYPCRLARARRLSQS